MPSRAWVVTNSSGVSIFQSWFVSMPSRAWVVTGLLHSCNGQKCSFNALTGLSCYYFLPKFLLYLDMFQCPQGLELLHSKTLLFTRNFTVSMPSRAWVVTCCINAQCYFKKCFNALKGLSCYFRLLMEMVRRWCFNALKGLSCYQDEYGIVRQEEVFQCPQGLELLQQECPIF